MRSTLCPCTYITHEKPKEEGDGKWVSKPTKGLRETRREPKGKLIDIQVIQCSQTAKLRWKRAVERIDCQIPAGSKTQHKRLRRLREEQNTALSTFLSQSKTASVVDGGWRCCVHIQVRQCHQVTKLHWEGIVKLIVLQIPAQATQRARTESSGS